jgi:MATE family multidrug resistance protein
MPVDPEPRADVDLTGQADVRDVLNIAIPLILASSGHGIRIFSDRIMLAWYAQTSIAAAMPAGLLGFSLMAFFIGTVGYVNAFVAQYTGANRPREVGLVIWQGLLLSLVGGVAVAACSLFAEQIFGWIGHAPGVQAEEVRYFRILTLFSFPGIALPAINGFWSGRGKTRVVMAIELTCAALNILLNALLIFGRAGFPELGIIGAGIGTVVSNLIGLGIALLLFLSPANRAAFDTRPLRLIDLPLMGRLIRFGLPNGLQFGTDLLAFYVFVALIGTYGLVELEAANIAFGINALAFLPVIGLGVAVSIMVGQGIGASNIDYAKRAVRSSLWIAFAYNAGLLSIFLLAPELATGLFARADDPNQIQVLAMAQRCLRYIAAFLMLDALYIVFGHAIRGAGDTRFSLVASMVVAWGTLALPAWLAIRFGASVWTLWTVLVIHVGLAGAVFGARYAAGHWQFMQVIDRPPSAESAVAECDLHADRGI